jgi:hypothetical protein
MVGTVVVGMLLSGALALSVAWQSGRLRAAAVSRRGGSGRRRR